MNDITKKCLDCKYELENNMPISYNQFAKDFQIETESGDALSCSGIAKCRTCDVSLRFLQECLIYEKLYLFNLS